MHLDEIPGLRKIGGALDGVQRRDPRAGISVRALRCDMKVTGKDRARLRQQQHSEKWNGVFQGCRTNHVSDATTEGAPAYCHKENDNRTMAAGLTGSEASWHNCQPLQAILRQRELTKLEF